MVLPAPFGPISPAIRPLPTVKLTFSSATIPPNHIVNCAISNKGAAAPAVVCGSGGGDVVMPIEPPFGQVSSSRPLSFFVFGRPVAAAGQQNVTRYALRRQREATG